MTGRAMCVFKIGGSLGRDGALTGVCRTLGDLARERPLLVVPGGGIFADAIRDCARRFPLGDEAAHWMAILGMDQYGLLLADLIPGARATDSLEEARALALEGRAPVFLPGALLRRLDPLPRSWDVTSDSIAVWIAGRLGAPLCVLVKDRDVFSGPGGVGETPPLPEMTMEELMACGGADPYLRRALDGSGTACWVVNGRRPARLAELAATGRTYGLRLSPDRDR